MVGKGEVAVIAATYMLFKLVRSSYKGNRVKRKGSRARSSGHCGVACADVCQTSALGIGQVAAAILRGWRRLRGVGVSCNHGQGLGTLAPMLCFDSYDGLVA